MGKKELFDRLNEDPYEGHNGKLFVILFPILFIAILGCIILYTFLL